MLESSSGDCSLFCILLGIEGWSLAVGNQFCLGDDLGEHILLIFEEFSTSSVFIMIHKYS